MTSDPQGVPAAAAPEEADSRSFLHQDSQPAERVEPPRFVTPGSFRLLWLGLAVTTCALLVIAVVVAGRIA